MSLTEYQVMQIENVIKKSLKNKFYAYKPESSNMPFHFACLVKTEWPILFYSIFEYNIWNIDF